MAINVKDYGAQCDWNGTVGHDDTEAIQYAINAALAANEDLEIPGLSMISASLSVDRPVDDAGFDRYFTIRGGGGFVVKSAIRMFSTKMSFGRSPVSQLVRFDGVSFESTNVALSAFVLDDSRFLRTSFEGCSFSKIKCIEASTYTQSLYFYDCNARRWAGSFFKGLHHNYDIQVVGGLYEAGGTCFDMVYPHGCKFITQIEGMSGTALKLHGCDGVDISCYFEANGADFDCRNANYPNHGISIHGSRVSRGSGYGFKWGRGTGMTSQGNVCVAGGHLHDLDEGSVLEINDDTADGSLSNRDATAHRGYREAEIPALQIRGGSSASFSVTNQVGRYSRIGNHVTCYFTCTLTSNATHAADTLYISAGLPFAAAIQSALCGQIEVVGGGSSSAYVRLTDPVRPITTGAVIPANVAGDSWSVRGMISYLAV